MRVRAPGNRELLHFAAPVILANLATPLLGLADTAIMGRFPDPAYIGAVAVGGTIFTMLLWIFSFLRQSTVGLTAQAVGAGDAAELDAALLRPLLLGAGIGLLLLLLAQPLREQALTLMAAAADVEGYARDYFNWRIGSAPFALANYALFAWFIGQRRTRLVMLLQIVLNASNVALTALFVLGFGWGPAGAGLGTALCEGLVCVWALWLARHALRPAAWRGGVLRRDRLLQLFRANRDIMIRTCLLMLTFTAFTRVGAGLSTLTLSANQILMQWLLVSAFFLDGFANAAEVWAGQAVGARDPQLLRVVAVRSGRLALLTALLLSGLIWCAREPLVALVTVSPALRALALDYLPWLAAVPLLSVAAFLFDGLFFGALHTAPLRDMMLIAVAAYFLALWWGLGRFGNHGLWAALLLFFVLRGALLALCWPGLLRRVAAAPPADHTL